MSWTSFPNISLCLKEWCTEQKQFADGEIVSEGKLALFLREKVIGRVSKYSKKDSPTTVGRETVLSYVNAMVNLYQNQMSLGNNTNGHPRGSVVRRLLDTCDSKEHTRRAANFEDRGKHTLKDGYTKDQLLQVSRYFLARDSNVDLRNRFDFLMGHSIFARGEDKRKMQFADMFLLELENEGPTPCFSLVATMRQGKTNQHNRVTYGAAIRHVNAEVCPVGALALYLFSRFHLDLEPFPDFSRRANWYNTYVLKGSNKFEEITYGTQYNAFRRGLDAAGIKSSKVTHVNRGSALNMIDDEQVSDDQQRRVGRWGTDRMVGCYLSSLPKQAIRSIAGFTTSPGNYHIYRAAIEPPEELKRKVFPDIESWKDKFELGLVQEDTAGPNFLELLAHLRTVLLQVNHSHLIIVLCGRIQILKSFSLFRILLF